MRILDRYLIKHLLIPIVFCSFTLIFLMVIADLFDHLSELMKNQTSFSYISQYYLNLIPYAFVQTIPWATFLGTVFLLVDFNAHNEILAMKVAGLSISKIMLPVLYIGFLIGIVSFLVNDRLVPQTFKTAQAILNEHIEHSTRETSTEPLVENFTYFGMANRLYYAKSFNAKAGKLEGLIILFFDQKKKATRRVFAKEALWESTGWRLKNVTEYESTGAGKMRGEPRAYADKVYEELTESPKDFANASSEAALLSYKKLKYYIEQLKENGLQAYPEMVELQYKLSVPWHSLITMLIAILFLTVARKKKVIAINVLYCLGLVFAFHVLGAMSLAMGKAGTLPPFVSAWTNIFIFSVGSIFFLDRAND